MDDNYFRAALPQASVEVKAGLLKSILFLQTVDMRQQFVYKGDFSGFSYVFRPGHSQHDALDALRIGTTGKKVNRVLDADTQGFFDAISHE